VRLVKFSSLYGVQRRAAKSVNGMENLQYEERLRRLGLMSFEARRVRGDSTEVVKFIYGTYAIDADVFFEYDKGNRKGHSRKLYKGRSRLAWRGGSMVGRRLHDRKVVGSSPVYALPRNNLGQVVLHARASVHQAV